MPDVTDVLRDRLQDPTGFQRMATLSVVGHAALVAALILAPKGWLMPVDDEVKTVMTISLGGGGTGPANGGMTPIAGRPTQAAVPPEDLTKREAVRPPAPVAPAMTLPMPGARPVRSTPTPSAKQAPDQARGRTPTKGTEVQPGSALTETGARGQGFGLSSGGGAGTGSTLDVTDFCCPDYLVLMTERIRTSWNPQAEVPGTVVIRFTIERDGKITGTALETSSGYVALDLNAQRAVQITRQLPPLPAAFTNPSLTVHLNFQYQR